MRNEKYNKVKNEMLSLFEGQEKLQSMLIKNWKRYTTFSEIFLKNTKIVSKEYNILDYGSGCPIQAKILSNFGFNIHCYEPYASDNDKKMADLLKIERYETKRENLLAQYDSIIMVDVIEHLWPIKYVMSEVNELCKMNGKLFISTPNVMRIRLYLKYLFRKTGHPTALIDFLEAENNYVTHQREFTINELSRTLEHFKFKVFYEKICDTEPNPKDLYHFHKFQSNRNIPLTNGYKNKIYEFVVKLFTYFSPNRFSNNIFSISKKYNSYQL